MARRVLVVEDDEFVGDLVTSTLRDQGWLACLAATCADARAAADKHPLDLLLLDIRLPDGDGWSLLRDLREGPLHAGVPVVVVSSFPVTPGELRRNGAHGYVPKPLSMPHLLATIRALWEHEDRQA